MEQVEHMGVASPRLASLRRSEVTGLQADGEETGTSTWRKKRKKELRPDSIIVYHSEVERMPEEDLGGEDGAEKTSEEGAKFLATPPGEVSAPCHSTGVLGKARGLFVCPGFLPSGGWLCGTWRKASVDGPAGSWGWRIALPTASLSFSTRTPSPEASGESMRLRTCRPPLCDWAVMPSDRETTCTLVDSLFCS